jgi:predicted permease
VVRKARALWRNATRRGRADAELHEELEAFVDLKALEYERAGLSPAEARRQARGSLGGADNVVEAVRDIRAGARWERLRQDLHFAVRSMRRAPAFSLTAIGVIALGVGAVSAVFSVASAVLFRPMPMHDPASMVWISGTHVDQDRRRYLSYPEAARFATDTATFDHVIAYQDFEATLAGGVGEPTRASALIVTSNYFTTLGVPPVLGRGFSVRDDARPGSPEVVLSYRLFEQRFNRDSSVIGRSVRVSGHVFTVVGVAAPGFVGLEIESTPELWVPLSEWRALLPGWDAGTLTNPALDWLRVAARLRPGADRAMAQVRATTLHDGLARGVPELTRTGVRLHAVTGSIDPPDRGDAISIFSMLILVPCLVLAIACSNVANLLLARAASRQREFALRVALGAARRRLIQQLVTESSLLAVTGGVAGLALTGLLITFAMAALPIPPQISSAVVIDWRVLAFIATITLGCAILIGVIPAFSITREGAAGRIREVSGPLVRRQRLMRSLIAVEVAASFVLLVMSGLFMRSLAKALRVDPGFNPAGMAMVTVNPTLNGYEPGRGAALIDAISERLATQAGIAAVGIADYPPMGLSSVHTEVALADERGERRAVAAVTRARSGLLATYGTTFLAGRDFTPDEQRRGAKVAVINQALAQRLWGDASPIGGWLTVGRDSTPRQVIGLARDMRVAALTGDPEPYIIVPELWGGTKGTVAIVARGTESPATLYAIRGVIRELDPALVVFEARSLSALIFQRSDESRLMSTVLAVFGTLALLLAAMGLYGVTTFMVTQQRREIGIRLAIGAQPRTVVREFVQRGLRLAGIGLGAGVLVGGAASVFVSRMLYGVGGGDIPTFLGAAAILVLVVTIASFVPPVAAPGQTRRWCCGVTSRRRRPPATGCRSRSRTSSCRVR